MILEKPIEELKKYKGISPIPEDFDLFWDKKIEEVISLKDNLVMKKRNYPSNKVEMFDCTFTGSGNAEVYFKYLRPTNGKNNKIMLCFHGYSGNSGDWVNDLHYVYEGYAIAKLDCRGQGGLSADNGNVKGNTLNGHIYRGAIHNDPNKLYFTSVFMDTLQMAKIVGNMEENNENYIVTTGVSQGGALSLVCASLLPSVKKCVTIYPFLSDYKAAWNNLPSNTAFSELKKYFRCFDPTHSKEDEFFHTLGYIDIKNLVKRVRADVFFATGYEDTVVSPTTQYAAFNRIESNKKHIIFPDFGHEYLQGINDMTCEFFLGNSYC
ncbi:MAG: acetylxylan esterase [Lachnospirales bacterium]